MHTGTRITGPVVIVTGHGEFASGLVSALELIMGPQEGLVAVDFPDSDTAVQLHDHLSAAIHSFSGAESIAIFCDLRGGTPFNSALSLVGDRSDVELACGVNLPFLLDFVGGRESHPEIAALLDRSAEEARTALHRFERPVIVDEVEEEDGDWS